MNSNGRTRVIKHGTKEITREGIEYELTANFELINDKHLAKASKDRTGLFMDKPEFIINAATGKKLIHWCNMGKSIETIKKEIESCLTVEGLKHIYNKYKMNQKQIYPLIIKRKSDLESVNGQLVDSQSIVEPSKEKNNGTDNQ